MVWVFCLGIGLEKDREEKPARKKWHGKADNREERSVKSVSGGDGGMHGGGIWHDVKMMMMISN